MKYTADDFLVKIKYNDDYTANTYSIIRAEHVFLNDGLLKALSYTQSLINSFDLNSLSSDEKAILCRELIDCLIEWYELFYEDEE